jgi:hypothetical protein
VTDLDTRAHHAKRLMEDPYLKEAFEMIRDAIHQGFEDLSPFDNETVPMTPFSILRLRLQLLDAVWDNLEHAVRQQKIEAFNAQLGTGNGRDTH